MLVCAYTDQIIFDFSDLPRGPIKNNSMRKLASKTLMEILPPEIEEMVSVLDYIRLGVLSSDQKFSPPLRGPNLKFKVSHLDYYDQLLDQYPS